MKILLINNCHYSRGGADNVYLNTGKLLNEKKNEVYYFSQVNANNYPYKQSDDFIVEKDFLKMSLIRKIISIPHFFYSREAKNKLNSLIHRIKPDIAHIHLYKGGLTSSILIALKKNNIPIVITLHDFGLLCPHNIMLDGKNNLCTRCVNGSTFNCIIHKCNRNNIALSTISAFEYMFHTTFVPFDKYFNTIITVSDFSKNFHLKSNRMRKELIKLYNFFPNLDNTQCNHNKGDYFIYFGRLSSEKGILTLLTAWKLKPRLSKLKLVGTGHIYNQLLKESIPENVELVGYKSGIELQQLICSASFTIAPSEVFENNPLSIIESYALGKPVIGSDIGGISEIIKDGVTGYLFKMKDIEGLSNKITLAEKINIEDYKLMSLQSREFAKSQFDPDTHYNQLIKIYQNCINSYEDVKNKKF